MTLSERSRQKLVDAKRAKLEVRERIWALLEREGATRPPGARGRIPNFVGTEAAADRLASLPVWQTARTLKSNPDTAQLPVRARALADGKLLYMAVPRLADPLPFFLLDPKRLNVSPREAASSSGASAVAPKVAVSKMRPVDLVICGNVAVNREGVRIGKGAGFSDIEVAMLMEAGLLSEDTKFVTTVHPLQVVDAPLPETEHDFRLDLIVTPDEVISCGPSPRPNGLLWDHLSEEKIKSIPALAALIPRKSDVSISVDKRYS
jgi:5-formyltetrahydrofolate cyclo-ligase